MHFTEILQLAARAWHETKALSDPEFNDCAVTHRENLAAAASGVINSSQAFNHFDRVVLRLYNEHQESLTKAQQLLEANPLLHSDEVMHMAAGIPHPLMGHATDAQMDAVREEFRGTAEPRQEINHEHFEQLRRETEDALGRPVNLEPTPSHEIINPDTIVTASESHGKKSKKTKEK